MSKVKHQPPASGASSHALQGKCRYPTFKTSRQCFHQGM
uniref:Uncharacterized protein n=1 Tax=Anguilla anguilla TaxID=7936 RepID=A0A0E9PQZ7_ANGAN